MRNRELIQGMMIFGLMSLGLFILGVWVMGWKLALGTCCIVASYRMADLMKQD